MSHAALDLSRVTVRFGGVTAVEEVDMRIERGAVHALIGPNGAGKTTLINVLTGVQRGYGGRVAIDGLDVTGWPAHCVARLGVARTFQTVQLMPTADVERNVRAGGFLRSAAGRMSRGWRADGSARAGTDAEAIIELLGLDAVRRRPVGELPLGHLRLVELGRALMAAPSIIVLDEPASGMTEDERGELMRLLSGVHRTLGLTFLVVEHQIDFLQAICRTATVLDRGRRIADGPLAQVLRDPAVVDAYVGELV